MYVWNLDKGRWPADEYDWADKNNVFLYLSFEFSWWIRVKTNQKTSRFIDFSDGYGVCSLPLNWTGVANACL